MLDWVKGADKQADITSASARLLLPAIIFMGLGPSPRPKSPVRTPTVQTRATLSGHLGAVNVSVSQNGAAPTNRPD